MSEHYVKAQYEDTHLDVGAEFTNMRDATVGVRDWITGNLPTSADGYLLLQSLDADNQLVWRKFTPSQTVDLRTRMDALIETIG